MRSECKSPDRIAYCYCLPTTLLGSSELDTGATFRGPGRRHDDHLWGLAPGPGSVLPPKTHVLFTGDFLWKQSPSTDLKTFCSNGCWRPFHSDFI